tara:strand:- start:1484 stop:2167 length:684 start_codon:yes stop_codon:yes gene_type:complete
MKKASKALIVTAAGSSQRFGSTQTKLLHPLGTETVLTHTLKNTCLFNWDEIILTTSKETKQPISDLVQELSLKTSCTIKIILGGKTRKDSVEKAVRQSQSEWVFIHDGARPIPSKTFIQRCIDAPTTYKALCPGIPVTDTIKEIKNGTVEKTLIRQNLVAIQTPQRFSRQVLLDAYDQITDTEITDEAMLIESCGNPVHIIEGCSQNHKVTYMQDLAYLETFLPLDG